jgi:NAD+ diphosphatase
MAGSDFVSGLVAPSEIERAWFFAFRARELLVSDSYALPMLRSPSDLGLAAVRTQYLGTLAGEHCFSVELTRDIEPPPGAQFRDLRMLYGRLRDELFAVAGRAVQIMDWDRTHQFCGACGAPTQLSERARSRVCNECRHEAFPRLSPAIIVAVERGDEILLARGPHFPKGIYSMLAGFVDPGESLEDCVAREVFEETGVRVKNVRYFGSQPWPFPNSLMVGFRADYESGEIQPDLHEIEDAGFYRYDALPMHFNSRFSISQWLLADFLKRKGVELPDPGSKGW